MQPDWSWLKYTIRRRTGQVTSTCEYRRRAFCEFFGRFGVQEWNWLNRMIYYLSTVGIRYSSREKLLSWPFMLLNGAIHKLRHTNFRTFEPLPPSLSQVIIVIIFLEPLRPDVTSHIFQIYACIKKSSKENNYFYFFLDLNHLELLKILVSHLH